MLPVVREQGIAYAMGGIFAKRDVVASDEPSPSQIAAKAPLAGTGAILTDEPIHQRIGAGETNGEPFDRHESKMDDLFWSGQ